MFPRITNKEIKIDKILRDLHIFTVMLLRTLACGFPDGLMEANPLTLFRSSSIDYYPCTCQQVTRYAMSIFNISN